MNINYNIDHKLLSLPIFQEKRSALNQLVLLNVLSLIVHFTKHNKQCQVWINQLADDYGCTSRIISKAVKDLVQAKLVKEIKPWNHKTKEAGWYMACTKQVHGKHQAGAPSAQVNNNKLFKREDAAKASPPFRKNELPQLTDNKPSWENKYK